MKKLFRFTVLAAAGACCLLPAQLPAQFTSDQIYVKLDLGGNYTPSTDLREFFGPVVPGSEVSFDPGFRAGVGFGYEWLEWFATELEAGVLGNSISSITGAQRVDAYLAQAPFFVNAKFQLRNRSRFTPYIGGGVGGSALSLNIDRVDYGPISVHGDEQDVVFAYQGFAGVRFVINEHMDLGVEYRYIGSDAPSFDGGDGPPFGAPFNDNVRFGRLNSHVGSFALNFHF